MLKEGIFLGRRYEILGRIGSGGMADVYKGKDHKLNRYVAVKVLKSDYRNDETFIQKFVSEAQAAAGLMHPNVVNVYDVGQDRGLYYMVMELVEGITLKEYIEKKGQLSAKETISISIQMVSGIQAAHNHHIIHRDIKPQNIIISKDGKVKVTDFGIARATTSTKTISTNVMGSVHYTSPEQARGGIVDERSDIYSAGITMYEMITGHVPFDGDSTVTVAIKHLKEQIISPAEVVPDIPYSLERIIMKCTEKNTERRYQDCQELITDLKHSLVDPNGDFVNFTAPMGDTGDHTILMSDEELKQIKKHQYAQEEEYDDYEDDDYDANSYDNDDYDADDDYDDDYDRRKNVRRNTDNRKRNDVDPNTKKIMKILMVVVIAIIAMVVIFLGGKAAGVFKNGVGINTSDTETKVVVPNLLGMTEEAAKEALSKKKLGYSVSARKASDEYEAGEIMEQETKANTKVAKNTEIKVVVSTGPETKMVTVQDVVGQSESDAQKTLENLGLIVESQAKNDDSVEAGKVISTDPAAGTELEEGSKVTMYVSLGAGKVEVPGVVGWNSADAQTAIQNAGLTVGLTEKYSDDVEAGLVISQDVEGGTKVKKGTTVNLVVSKGKETKMVTVPALNSGKTQSEAEQALRDAGLDVGTVTEEYDSSVSKGYVISQTVAAGSQVEEGTAIGFVVSKGAEPVTPDEPSTEENVE